MAIGVYRIYVGSGWAQPDALRRLCRLLDRLPGFLYRIDRLPEAALQDEPESVEMLRARVRIALTQAHIAILHPSHLLSPSAQTVAELDIARTGFRRRIPILGITELPIPAGTETSSPSLDRIVALDQDQIAGAIQELAEEAIAERRKMTEHLLQNPLASPQFHNGELTKSTPVESNDGHRPLPIAEIIAALEELKLEKAAHKQHS